MPLRPEENITKILLSTPSNLSGEYEEEKFLVSIAADRTLNIAWANNHEYLIFAMKTPPPPPSIGFFIVFPDYSVTGDFLSTCLSVLYGKRFDNHGLIESSGKFWLPEYSHFDYYNPHLPFNSRKPRPDLEIPLRLDEINRIAPLLHEGLVDPHFRDIFSSAGRFYVHALQHAETQPEIAFLDLITCGEILSNFYDYDPDDLLNTQTKTDLNQIKQEIKCGAAIVRRIRGQLFGVKRIFVKTVLYLLNPYFFQQSEAKEGYARLNQEDVSIRIKAAYDLRSRYVHTGVNFGRWIHPNYSLEYNAEVQIGEPAIKDKEFKKILIRCPTFIGMERIMRFCLLRFMHINGIFINLSLEGKGLRMPEEETADDIEN
jgi:hypothetical protein